MDGVINDTTATPKRSRWASTPGKRSRGSDMTTYTVTVEEAPRREDVQILSQGLTLHALPYTQVPGFIPLAVFLRDAQGTIVGGVWGQINWNWLHVGLFWVAEALHGSGSADVCWPPSSRWHASAAASMRISIPSAIKPGRFMKPWAMRSLVGSTTIHQAINGFS